MLIRLLILTFFLIGAAAPKSEHQGTVVVWHYDVAPLGEYGLTVKTDKEGTLELRFPKGHKLNPSKYRTGQKIKVHGRKAGQVLELDSESDIEPQSAISPEAYSVGVRTVLVMIGSWPGQSPPIDIAGSRSVMQMISDFFRDQSGGTTWLAGKKNPLDPADIIYTPATVNPGGTCTDSTLLHAAGENGAAAQGYNTSQYNRRVFFYPRIPCSWSGAGSIGPAIGAESQINAEFTLRVIGHEMGHNDGHYHNHSEASCAGCGSVEYGNFLGVMGNTSGMIRMNEREHIGWPVAYQLVTAPGDYAVDAFDVASSKIKALKIPLPNQANCYYWATFNSGQGQYGAGKPIAPFVERSCADPNSYNLIGWVNTRGDFQLQAGDVMADTVNGVYISLKSQSATGAVFTIGAPAPVKQPNNVTLFIAGGTPPPAVKAPNSVTLTVK